MKLVVFPHCEYSTQLKNDYSSFFALFYPFDIIRDDELGILVKKDSIDKTHFFLCRQNFNDITSLKLGGYEKIIYMDAFCSSLSRRPRTIYFQNEGEMASPDIEEQLTSKYWKSIFSSIDKGKYPIECNYQKDRYFEPKLHFTRNFYFYGFHFNMFSIKVHLWGHMSCMIILLHH